jgi:hypothetical protein
MNNVTGGGQQRNNATPAPAAMPRAMEQEKRQLATTSYIIEEVTG